MKKSLKCDSLIPEFPVDSKGQKFSRRLRRILRDLTQSDFIPERCLHPYATFPYRRVIE